MLRKFLQILFLLNFCVSAYAQQDLHIWEKYAQHTEIIRDQWGIPHIYGKSDADAVFGMIYAQCEDDFNRVETNFITSMGRKAEVEGINELYADLRMQLYIDPIVIKQEYDNSPAWLKQLMDAWAAGINYYLHTHPEVTPKLITQFEPWMALTFSEGSIGGDIETISVNKLKSFYDGDFHTQISYVERNFDEEPKGSNGFAIAPSLTKNGNALLMINPHTSFYFRPEIHMVSEEGLNAYGAVTWGQFFVYQGFNEYNGWMHTSSRADAIDHYALTVEERDGKYHYLFGKDWRLLRERKIHLKYKENNQLEERALTVYYSHHGPVIMEEDGKWVAISLMVEREKALTQSYQRTKTTSHEAYKSVMELKTNSSNNTVYADKDGNIVYYHGNFIPIRDERFDWRNMVDGSNPATDWKGLHDIEEMIYIENPSNGWIQNANSTPYTAAGDQSPNPADYPAYMAWDLENARGINAVRILKDQSNFTLESLIATSYDPTLMAFKPLIPELVKAYHNLKKRDPRRAALKAPVDTLKNWNLHTQSNSVATAVAVHFGSQLIRKSASLERPWDAYIFEYIAQNAPENMYLEALENAIQIMESDFGSWNVQWGDINRYQRITAEIQAEFDDDKPSIPISYNSSFWGSLAAYGSRQYPNTKQWYGTVGNSFVAAVEFGEKVVAKSILAGGQSGNPDSPHFTDQALMYSRGEFKDVNFYREDVLKNKKNSYRPGQKLE